MLIVDANVLIYATNQNGTHHDAAHSWLDGALRSGMPIGLAWLVILAFVRITTKRGLLPRPLSTSQALDVVDAWLGHPNTVVVEPTHRHHVVLRELLERTGTAGNLTNDAHLAALALEHGATVASFDSDFARFPNIRWVVPTGPEPS